MDAFFDRESKNGLSQVLTAIKTFPGPTACHLQITKRLSTWPCSSPSPDRSVSLMFPKLGAPVLIPFLQRLGVSR